MLFYAAADIHGHPLRVQSMAAQIAIHRPDILLLAGDILNRRHPSVTLAALDQLGLPVLATGGNSDGHFLPRLLMPFPRLRFLHLSSIPVGSVEIVGISGTLPLPLHSRIRLLERELVAKASRMLGNQSVLMVHPPPYGVRDRVLGRFHAGSRAVRRLVDGCSPALVVCGHIHEQAGVEMLGRTLVVNCALGPSSNGALIRYDGHSAPDWRILSPPRS